MTGAARRIRRERKTIEKMLGLYCRDHHGRKSGLCGECHGLWTYAMARLEKCPLRVDKPQCNQCKIHCYKPAIREQVRQVMRYSGPRMLWRHPVAAVQYLIDKRRQEPISSVPKRS